MSENWFTRTRLRPSRRMVLWMCPAAFATPVWSAEAATIRIATLKFGTVNWELDTIRHNGFDTGNGITIDVLGLAGSSAAKIAFEGGSADALVADWIWVARQRAAGKDYVFIPYSRTVGSLIAASDRGYENIQDLRGKKIGIAGGPLDKNWLILQAYAASQGFDLKAETEQVYGAPPLISQQALSGGVDAIITYWHYEAKLRTKGFAPVMSVEDAATQLGLAAEIPLLGYVLRGEFARENPAAVEGLIRASRAAKTLLAQNDAAWDRLRPRMNAADDAEFSALKDGFRHGIPATAPIDPATAAALFKIMAELGGAKLVGDAETLPDGVFYAAEE